ncbi:hypothetical protein K458DRAFT_924 [Lentithecium fluviatile CBS 122367]|uniref:Uncharacterized protein n=1 Tax=Lentithecium fluviatile CBS 122367 TaxID=1168545 RepID=A0A6G1JMU2_9PLEO|nr:hypothetical protein K458DRAFT_924 [Lentithecium fluviatile CBS 122367]
MHAKHFESQGSKITNFYEWGNSSTIFFLVLVKIPFPFVHLLVLTDHTQNNNTHVRSYCLDYEDLVASARYANLHHDSSSFLQQMHRPTLHNNWTHLTRPLSLVIAARAYHDQFETNERPVRRSGIVWR